MGSPAPNVDPPPAFTPDRAEGLARLARFLPNAGRRYAASRNIDFGPNNRENVSTLSPWIRHRLVTEKEVVKAVLGRHAYSSAEKFIQEVVWRTYWKGWLELRPGVWDDYRCAVEAQLAALQIDGDLERRWRDAVEGRTGVACFDAWAQELVDTGYLHNHTRMWFASIWIFTLDLPWELGADFFLRHLLDGDPASNTLSWRWVAGLQTRGKTYQARSDNIAKFTDGRFPHTDGLAPRAIPVDGPLLPAPQPLPDEADRADDASWALLLHEDDCNPETVPLPETPALAVAGFQCTRRRSPLGANDAAVDFAVGAVRHSLKRIGNGDGHAPTLIDANAGPDPVLAWARASGARQIVTPYAPVGPVREILDHMAPELAQSGIALLRLRRPWDSTLWPLATKGFFAFKEKLPASLRMLGLV